MLKEEYRKLRNEVNYQLLTYRRNLERLSGHGLTDGEREMLTGWCEVIARVYGGLKKSDREKARAMVRLFGLYAPVPRYKGTMQRILRLTIEFNVSESTLYRWRSEIIQMTMLAAMEAGLFHTHGKSEQ